MGCDVVHCYHLPLALRFQSTHPHGVRHGNLGIRNGTDDFNPRTRMGCDQIDLMYGYGYVISIHAPAWGATLQGANAFANFVFQSTHPHGVRLETISFKIILTIFQSTHPHGVRQAFSRNTIRRILFQSTHPHGVRPWLTAGLSALMRISIHAPAWGATVLVVKALPAGTFQSTHPHGVRPSRLQRRQRKSYYFNPRTRMGCDSKST